MFLTIVVFLIVLGTLVLVHELGHFLVARRNGVVAEEFGFGFPPRLIGTYKDRNGKRRWVWGNKEIEEEIKKREETIYSINLIPLGGFVKIKGEDGNDKSEPDSFASQKIWTRFKILAAGVTMNLILGIVLLTAALWLGMPEQIGDDEILPGSKIVISQVLPDSPAQKSGIKMGDEVVAIASSTGEQSIRTVSGFKQEVNDNVGKELTIKVLHPGDKNITGVTVIPTLDEKTGAGRVGVGLANTLMVKHTLGQAFLMSFQTVYALVLAIFFFLKDLVMSLFTSQSVSNEVAGPVGIAIMTADAMKLGLAYLLNFTALLSINLAVINFLPLPALDGGRALFLLIEKIKGAPVSQRVEGIVHTTGFIFLLGVMALVIINDFNNFKVFDSIKNAL